MSERIEEQFPVEIATGNIRGTGIDPREGRIYLNIVSNDPNTLRTHFRLSVNLTFAEFGKLMSGQGCVEVDATVVRVVEDKSA